MILCVLLWSCLIVYEEQSSAVAVRTISLDDYLLLNNGWFQGRVDLENITKRMQNISATKNFELLIHNVS